MGPQTTGNTQSAASSGMFPQILDEAVEESGGGAALAAAEIVIPGIASGVAEFRHAGEPLRVLVPPVGLETYHSASTAAMGRGRPALSAPELASVVGEALAHPFNGYGTTGKVDGLTDLISVGKAMQMTPRLVSPGDILRREWLFSWTAILTVPAEVELLGSHGGIFVCDFTDPAVQPWEHDLAKRVEAGDPAVRFVPSAEIDPGLALRYGTQGRSSSYQFRRLAAAEFAADPLARAVLGQGLEPLAAAGSSFLLYYDLPARCRSTRGAVTVIRARDNGEILIDASNKSIGYTGNDVESKHDLLKRGFLFCKVE